MELDGAPVDVITGVRQRHNVQGIAFSCSQTGTCVYNARSTAASRTVVMVDRDRTAQPPPWRWELRRPTLLSSRGKIALWVEQLLRHRGRRCRKKSFVTRLTSDGDNHYRPGRRWTTSRTL
jgi:hypothetical protein